MSESWVFCTEFSMQRLVLVSSHSLEFFVCLSQYCEYLLIFWTMTEDSLNEDPTLHWCRIHIYIQGILQTLLSKATYKQLSRRKRLGLRKLRQRSYSTLQWLALFSCVPLWCRLCRCPAQSPPTPSWKRQNVLVLRVHQYRTRRLLHPTTISPAGLEPN